MKWRFYYFRVLHYFQRLVRYKTFCFAEKERIYNNQRQKRKRARNKTRFIKEKGECARCHKKENLTIDHIIPRSKGGARYDKRNWQVLCNKCNQWKKDYEIKHLKGFRKVPSPILPC